MHLYVQSKSDQQIRFEVLSFDKASGIGKLRSALGTDITRDISRAALDKYGYAIVQSEEPLPLIGDSAVTQSEEDRPVRKKPKAQAQEEDDDD